jgi:hypothetical protein
LLPLLSRLGNGRSVSLYVESVANLVGCVVYLLQAACLSKKNRRSVEPRSLSPCCLGMVIHAAGPLKESH